jgi:hypothetical protein
VLNLLDAVHVTHPGNLAEVLLQASKVTQIDGFDDEVDMNGSVGGGTGFDAANISAILGNDGRELLEKAGPVVDEEREFDGICSWLGACGILVATLRLRPLDLDAPVSLVKQVLDVGTASRVHGDTFATRDVTNNLFAANGIATSRSIDEEVILPFDLE